MLNFLAPKTNSGKCEMSECDYLGANRLARPLHAHAAAKGRRQYCPGESWATPLKALNETPLKALTILGAPLTRRRRGAPFYRARPGGPRRWGVGGRRGSGLGLCVRRRRLGPPCSGRHHPVKCWAWLLRRSRRCSPAVRDVAARGAEAVAQPRGAAAAHVRERSPALARAVCCGGVSGLRVVK